MSVAPISSLTALPLDPAKHASPTKLTGPALRNASPAEQRVAVAAQFEAILVRQLLGKTMNSMLGGEKGGVASSVYGDMLSDTVAQQLTSGPGLGLGRMLVKQFTPRAEHLSGATSAVGAATSALVPEANASHANL